MSLDSILVILRAIIDISLVWMVIYFILKNIKNNVNIKKLFFINKKSYNQNLIYNNLFFILFIPSLALLISSIEP